MDYATFVCASDTFVCAVLVCSSHVYCCCMSNVYMLQDAMMSLNEELQSSQGTIVGLKSSMNEVHTVD